jgi:hypothetical protein
MDLPLTVKFVTAINISGYRPKLSQLRHTLLLRQGTINIGIGIKKYGNIHGII